MICRLSKQISLKVSPSLKFMVHQIAEDTQIKPADLIRLFVHQGIERYTNLSSRDELYAEIGRLHFRDSLVLLEKTDGGPAHELSGDDVEPAGRAVHNASFAMPAPSAKKLKTWLAFARYHLESNDLPTIQRFLGELNEAVPKIPAGSELAEVVKQLEALLKVAHQD